MMTMIINQLADSHGQTLELIREQILRPAVQQLFSPATTKKQDGTDIITSTREQKTVKVNEHWEQLATLSQLVYQVFALDVPPQELSLYQLLRTDPGGFYQAHSDSGAAAPRETTHILYLGAYNHSRDQWQVKGEGGELKVYLDPIPEIVEACFGTYVRFPSKVIHACLPVEKFSKYAVVAMTKLSVT